MKNILNINAEGVNQLSVFILKALSPFVYLTGMSYLYIVKLFIE